MTCKGSPTGTNNHMYTLLPSGRNVDVTVTVLASKIDVNGDLNPKNAASILVEDYSGCGKSED